MKEEEEVKLQISHVNKKYKLGNKSSFQALTDVNAVFHKGELVSIIGESGSGKSTLMNLIGGLDSDFEGDIIADGQNLRLLKDKELDKYRKNKVGFVFQSFNLIPHLTILDNVTIALTLSNEKESVKLEKAEKLLTRLGLADQMKKKPNQLSGGQKQRVAIARALINEPEIILADEPTGALDSGTTLQILEILKEIADEGKLVIMVTHSEKVASISSRIVEISDGKIVRDELNPDYKKGSKKKILVDEPKSAEEKKSGKKKILPQRSTKQNLSLWSALRLSVHNMWASKVKNLLMAFGVSISVLAVIIMLAFGSGLTDYINNLANEYNDPLYVTVRKVSSEEDEEDSGGGMGGMGGMGGLIKPVQFEDAEIEELLGKINGPDGLLAQNDFPLIPEENITFGYNMVSYKMAFYNYSVDSEGNYDENGESQSKDKKIYYIYTTPSYYGQTNMVAGQISGYNEVMLSKAAVEAMGFSSPEELVDAKVKINVDLSTLMRGLKTSEIDEEKVVHDKDNNAILDDNGEELKLLKTPTVSGIIDVSAMFEGMPIMYISWDYFQALVRYVGEYIISDTTYTINPSSIFLKTDSEETTEFIKSHLKDFGNYTGSVEQQLAGMFNSMLSTFSIALAVIAGISLIVSAIMILVVLYMSVTERTQEIGVLKSIGARRKDIKRIFSSESFLVGLLSGIVGIIYALVVYAILVIVFNATLGVAPLSLRWWYFAGSLAVSIIISVLSGLYPAAKAAKLDPVESLRHE